MDLFVVVLSVFVFDRLEFVYSEKEDLLFKEYDTYKRMLGRSIQIFEDFRRLNETIPHLNVTSKRYHELSLSLSNLRSVLLQDYDFAGRVVTYSKRMLHRSCERASYYDRNFTMLYCSRYCGTVKVVEMTPFELFQPDIRCAIAFKQGAYSPRCHLPLDCNDIVENVTVQGGSLNLCYGRVVPANRFIPKYKIVDSTDSRFVVFCNESVRFAVPEYLMRAPETLKTMFVGVNGSYALFHDRGYADIFSKLSMYDISVVEVSEYAYVCDDRFYAMYPQGFLRYNVFPSRRRCLTYDRGVCYDAYYDPYKCPDDYEVDKHDSSVLWRLFRLYVWERSPLEDDTMVVLDSADPAWYSAALRLVKYSIKLFADTIYEPFRIAFQALVDTVVNLSSVLVGISDKWYDLVVRGLHIPSSVIVSIVRDSYRLLYQDPIVRKFFIDVNKGVVDYFVNRTAYVNFTLDSNLDAPQGIISWLFGGLVDIFKPIMKVFISFIDDILETVIKYLLLTIPLYESLLSDLVSKLKQLLDLLIKFVDFIISILIGLLLGVDSKIMLSEYFMLYVLFALKFRNNVVAIILLSVSVVVFGLRRRHPSLLCSIVNPEFKNYTGLGYDY